MVLLKHCQLVHQHSQRLIASSVPWLELHRALFWENLLEDLKREVVVLEHGDVLDQAICLEGGKNFIACIDDVLCEGRLFLRSQHDRLDGAGILSLTREPCCGWVHANARLAQACVASEVRHSGLTHGWTSKTWFPETRSSHTWRIGHVIAHTSRQTSSERI